MEVNKKVEDGMHVDKEMAKKLEDGMQVDKEMSNKELVDEKVKDDKTDETPYSCEMCPFQSSSQHELISTWESCIRMLILDKTEKHGE